MYTVSMSDEIGRAVPNISTTISRDQAKVSSDTIEYLQESPSSEIV